MAPDAETSIASDSAAETLCGHTVHWEPTGPNTPLAKGPNGQELYPGPGDNSFVDRPGNCVAQTVPAQPAGTCILGGGSNVPGPRTDAGANAGPDSSTILDNSIVVTDVGRSVTGAGIPSGAFVGRVHDLPVTATAPNPVGIADIGQFRLVDSSGHPLLTTGTVSGITPGADTPASDPLFNADRATTGSVLISPYIRPGSVSTVYYNHYSWLRTMEDLFSVRRASPGLDGLGHIGYAAQPGLAPFGRDVFTNPKGHPGHGGRGGHGGHGPWGVPLVGLVAVGHRRGPRSAGRGQVPGPGHHALLVYGDLHARVRRHSPDAIVVHHPRRTRRAGTSTSKSTDERVGPALSELAKTVRGPSRDPGR